MGTLGIIISAIAAIFAGVASYASQKKTNNFNQSQYEDWKEYNTPANQMSRLTEAGLNPYQVNGVSNTLSQPFQVGQSANLSSLFGNLSQAAGQAANYQLKSDANAIRKDAVEVQRGKLELEKEFTELKKEQMRTAIKNGDAQTALFWSSVTQKDIVSNYLKRTLPFRVGSAYYDYLQKQQNYSFGELMNPLKLQYYPLYQEAMINNILARTSHLKWYENFALNQFLFNQDKFNRQMDLGWANHSLANRRLLNDYDIANRRLGLSGLYFNLAERKFFADVLFRGLDGVRSWIPFYRAPLK